VYFVGKINSVLSNTTTLIDYKLVEPFAIRKVGPVLK
jgi:hypothetical protein